MTFLTITSRTVLRTTLHSPEIHTITEHAIQLEVFCMSPPSNSVRFGDNSFKLKAIRAWNSAVNDYPNSDFFSLSKNVFKKLMVTYLLSKY